MAEHASPGFAEAAGEAPARLGPYEIVGELGRGGMGIVYRAVRPDLQREFALKVIRAGADADPEAVARFQREARAAARLSGHPGIVGVHDIGEVGGTAYFAMDLVPGESLEAVIRREAVAPPDAARLVEQAARAIQHAHEHGVLHRDLKPANILVTADGRARVTDFGLAKRADAGPESARLTKSGQVLGTPAYMPPEQAAGDRLDARSDVYGLGATLYEALTGVAPFAGDTALNVLAKVMTDDPAPPRRLDPRVPPELQVIALKCLAKEPERRYPTAGALADDLARYLAGEAIVARPPGLVYRWRRQLARRKLAAGIAVAALALLATGAAVVLPRWFRAETAALARLRQVTDMALDAALRLRRAKDLPGMRAFAAQVETACREAAAAMPQAPEPHWRLGRMYRALMRDDDALAAQEAALARDPDFAPARYERVVLTARAFEARVGVLVGEELRRAGGVLAERMRAGDLRMVTLATRQELARSDDAARRLDDRMREDLAWLDRDAGALSGPALQCVRGLLARLREERPAARAALAAALTADGTLVEAHEALGAMVDADEGGAAAVAAWDAAIAADGGYVPFYERRTLAWLRLAQAPGVEPTRAAAAAAAAREDCETMLRLVPGQRSARDLLARACLVEARPTALAGRDPDPLLARGEAALRAALADAPGDAVVLGTLGHLQHMRGTYLYLRGADGEPRWADAVATLGQALAIDAGNPATWRERAAVYQNRATRLGVVGGDPRPHLGAARQDLDRALAIDPTDGKTWTEYGEVLGQIVRELMGAGEDVTATAQAATTALEQARRLRPTDVDACCALADLHARLALGASLRGADATGPQERALALYTEAMALSPTGSEPRGGRGRVYEQRGRERLLRGEDGAAADFEAALADFDAAVAAEPGRPDTLLERAQLRIMLASVSASDPAAYAAQLAAAQADADRAGAAGPGDPRPPQMRSEVFLLRAAMAQRQGEDTEPLFAEAEAALTSALALAPDSAAVWLGLGKVCNAWFRDRVRTGRDDWEALGRRAVEAFTRSLALEPGSVDALQARGGARFALGLAALERGTDPGPALDESVADYDAALARNDRFPLVWAGAARTHQVRARQWAEAGRPAADEWAAAVRCWERAAALDGRYAASRDLAWCREQLTRARGQ